MKQSFKTLAPLRWLAVILLAYTLLIACNNETKKTETPTEMEKAKKDSLPVLDKDPNSSTRPETIKN